MSESDDDQKPREERVRYVHVSDPSLSGWPEMVKTVMEADKAKVKDCTKDIDTLLVFAGLYSAVLTAFLIESYKALQPDKQDVMIGLLQQMVVQTFIAGPGYLNSPTSLPRPPPFEPPLWAVRVNVLWFTGLILSLGAASLGIFVKQWLQEYLAYEYTTPRERLRAQQYRAQALSQWGLFEIAALLPLLLQISLGLFFLGLCIFTSAIHVSVGYTTLPLVAAWVFLIFITTIAPLFSPRCPYKTRFLKPALKAGRRIIAPTSRRLASVIWRYAQFLRHKLASVVRWCAGPFSRPAGHVTSQKWCQSVRRRGIQCTQGFRKAFQNVTIKEGAYKVDDNTLLEEEQVVKTEQEDVEILLSADALVSDDGLLPTMLGILRRQTGSNPATLIKFILQVTSRRVGQTLPRERLTCIPDLQALSKPAWTILTDSIVDALTSYGTDALTPDSPGSVLDAVIFLLSYSRYELSQSTACALLRFLAPEMPGHLHSSGLTIGGRLIAEGESPCCPGLSRGSLVTNIQKLQDTPVCLYCIMAVYTRVLCQDPRHCHTSLNDLLHSHLSESPGFVARSQDILEDALDFLMQFVSWIILAEKHWINYNGIFEASYIILQYAATLGRPQHAINLSQHLLEAPFLVHSGLCQFTAVDLHARVGSDCEHVFIDAIVSANPQQQSNIVHNLTETLDDYCAGEFDDSDWDPLDLVRACRLCLQAYVEISQSRALRPYGPLPWQAFWDSLSKAIRRYYEKEAWKTNSLRHYYTLDTPPTAIDDRLAQDGVLARECLDLLTSYINSIATAGFTGFDDTPAAIVGPLLLFAPQERIRGMLDWLLTLRPFSPPPPTHILTSFPAYPSTPNADGYTIPSITLHPPDTDALTALLPMILDTLQQPAGRTLPTLIMVVLHVAGQRAKQPLPTERITSIPDLQALTTRVWTALTDSVANAIASYGDGPLTSDTPDSAIDAIIFLLSHSRYELSQSAARALLRFLAPGMPSHGFHSSGWTIGGRLISGGDSSYCPGLSRGFLVTNIQKMQDARVCLLCIMGMYVRLLCRNPEHDHTSLNHLLRTHLSESPEFAARSRDILDDALDFLMQFVSWTVSADKLWEHYTGAQEASYIILQHGATLGRPQHAVSLCQQMLISSLDFIATHLFIAIDPRARVKPDREHVFVDAFVSANAQQQIGIFHNLLSLLREYCAGLFDGSNYRRIDYVRACRLYLRIYLEVSLPETSMPEDYLPWEALWGLLSRSIRRYHERETWKDDLVQDYWHLDTPPIAIDDLFAGDKALACECLDLLASHLNSIMIVDSTEVDDAPAALIGPLWLFVPQERMRDYEALRRFLPPLAPSPHPSPMSPAVPSPIPRVDVEHIRTAPDEAGDTDESGSADEKTGGESEKSGATNEEDEGAEAEGYELGISLSGGI